LFATVRFPAEGTVGHPARSIFREWLARAEGFALDEMDGFGGDRQWHSVSTTSAPLLHHPDDDGPDLTPTQCASMLPRLEALLDADRTDGNDLEDRRRIEDVRQLVTVLRICVNKDVDLIFG
jgi:hypothetical protein